MVQNFSCFWNQLDIAKARRRALDGVQVGEEECEKDQLCLGAVVCFAECSPLDSGMFGGCGLLVWDPSVQEVALASCVPSSLVGLASFVVAGMWIGC